MKKTLLFRSSNSSLFNLCCTIGAVPFSFRCISKANTAIVKPLNWTLKATQLYAHTCNCFFRLTQQAYTVTYSVTYQASKMERFAKKSLQLLTVNCFHKTLHLRCLTEFCIRLCCHFKDMTKVTRLTYSILYLTFSKSAIKTAGVKWLLSGVFIYDNKNIFALNLCIYLVGFC